MKSLKTILLFSISIFLSGCVEIIPFETEFSEQLVINGKITNSTTHTPYISVAFTTLEGSDSRNFVESATVSLIENNENRIPFTHTSRGKYEPIFSFIGTPGYTYQAEVELDGKIYRSVEEVMPELVGTDKIRFQSDNVTRLSREGLEISIPAVSIFIETDLPEGNALIKWELEEVYTYTEMLLPAFKFPFFSPELCFISKPLFADEIPLFSTLENTADQIAERLIIERPIDETFEEIHYFGVIQHSLTQEAYNYWNRINDAANRNGTLFETPPAAVRGNIFNIEEEDQVVLGYFEAAKVDTSSFFVTPEILSLYVPPVCGVISASRFDRIPSMCTQCVIDQLGVSPSCINCLLVPGSSKERPPYFPDINYD